MREAGVGVTTIWEWETGRRTPGLALFCTWCRAVGLEPGRGIETAERLLTSVDG